MQALFADPECKFGGPAIANISGDTADARDGAIAVANREVGGGGRDETAVLFGPGAFHALDTFAEVDDAVADGGADVHLLRFEEHLGRPAEDIGGRVAEEAFGAAIPRGDEPIKVGHDHAVVGEFHDCAEPGLGFFGGLASADVGDAAANQLAGGREANEAHFALDVVAGGGAVHPLEGRGLAGQRAGNDIAGCVG